MSAYVNHISSKASLGNLQKCGVGGGLPVNETPLTPFKVFKQPLSSTENINCNNDIHIECENSSLKHKDVKSVSKTILMKSPNNDMELPEKVYSTEYHHLITPDSALSTDSHRPLLLNMERLTSPPTTVMNDVTKSSFNPLIISADIKTKKANNNNIYDHKCNKDYENEPQTVFVPLISQASTLVAKSLPKSRFSEPVNRSDISHTSYTIDSKRPRLSLLTKLTNAKTSLLTGGIPQFLGQLNKTHARHNDNLCGDRDNKFKMAKSLFFNPSVDKLKQSHHLSLQNNFFHNDTKDPSYTAKCNNKDNSPINTRIITNSNSNNQTIYPSTFPPTDPRSQERTVRIKRFSLLSDNLVKLTQLFRCIVILMFLLLCLISIFIVCFAVWQYTTFRNKMSHHISPTTNFYYPNTNNSALVASLLAPFELWNHPIYSDTPILSHDNRTQQPFINNMGQLLYYPNALTLPYYYFMPPWMLISANNSFNNNISPQEWINKFWAMTVPATSSPLSVTTNGLGGVKPNNNFVENYLGEESIDAFLNETTEYDETLAYINSTLQQQPIKPPEQFLTNGSFGASEGSIINSSAASAQAEAYREKLHTIQTLLRQALRTKAHPSCTQMLVIPCLIFPYNGTVMPNAYGHKSQTEVWNHLKVYSPVFGLGCHSLAFLFFCSMLAPRCGSDGQPILPCRSLCEEIDQHCSFFYDVFYVPSVPLNCSLLKESMDPFVCVGAREVKLHNKKKCDNGFVCDENRCLNRSWVCDGIFDCKDKSDEWNCGPKTENTTLSTLNRDISLKKNWTYIKQLNARVLPIFHHSLLAKSKNSLYLLCTKPWVDVTSDVQSICLAKGYTKSLYYGSAWKRESHDSDNINEDPYEANIHTDLDVANSLDKLRNNQTLCERGSHDHLFECVEPVCGKVSHYDQPKKPTSRIIGGQISEIGAWPWVVSIYGGSREVYFCIGSILDRRWILTAAHCLGNQSNPQQFMVKISDDRRPSYNPMRQIFNAAKLIKHPNFIRGANENDIALIKLPKDIIFNTRVQPVCLPSPNFYPEEGTMCHVAGWGRTKSKENYHYANHLHDVGLPILSNRICNEWFRNSDIQIKDSMMCAGYEEGKKDACQGDSGGPLLCKNYQGSWTIMGIVSWGILCAEPKLPGVYTRVPLYVDWILETISKN